jgi:hypothetical protein
VRWQTGKVANLALFGGAIMALCSERTKRARLSFPGYFSLVRLPSASSQCKLIHKTNLNSARFFWRSKRNEHHKKKEGAIL